MKELKSFGALAKALERNVAEMKVALAAQMEISAIAVVSAAREEIGHYQREDMGPFPIWEELKDSTKEDRVRSGYTENDPLLRSGELRDSINYQASESELEFVVGSSNEIAEYQELGTNRIPPRPFLGPALHRNVPLILEGIGKAIEQTLAGE